METRVIFAQVNSFSFSNIQMFTFKKHNNNNQNCIICTVFF